MIIFVAIYFPVERERETREKLNNDVKKSFSSFSPYSSDMQSKALPLVKSWLIKAAQPKAQLVYQPKELRPSSDEKKSTN